MGLIDMSPFDRLPVEAERPRRRLAPTVDHDRSAATGRTRRMILDIERVQVIAADHDSDPNWRDAAAVLERVRATLCHDLLVPPGPTGYLVDPSAAELPGADLH